jgi:hypothetical protein
VQKQGAPTHPLAEYAGGYRHPAYGELEVRAGDGGLEGSFLGRDFILEHQRFNVFTFDGSPLSGVTARFEFDDAGDVRRILIPVSEDGVTLSFDRR